MADTAKQTPKAPEYDLTALLEAGCHFGHQRNKWHPKMAEYIYTEKEGIHIFDLVKTASQLQAAYEYAYNIGKEGKSMVFVGTKRQARETVKAAAESAGAFFITSRWLGGILTNWDQIQKSLKRMVEIEDGLKNDKFKGYTKYERMQLGKELVRLERFFAGVRGMKDKPGCLFVIDPKREKIAIKEANLVGVPVIALADSNADPSLLDLAIPANDDAVSSIKFIVDAVAEGYKAGKAARK